MMSINHNQFLPEESTLRADEATSSLEVLPSKNDFITDKTMANQSLENASDLKPDNVPESEAKPTPDQVIVNGSGANSENPEMIHGQLTLPWVSNQDNERSSITRELSIDASKGNNDPDGETKETSCLAGSSHLTVNLKSDLEKIVENVGIHGEIASMSPLEKSFAMMVYDHPDWSIHQIATNMGLDIAAFKIMVAKLKDRFKARAFYALVFSLLTDQLQWPAKSAFLFNKYDYHIARALATGQSLKALAQSLRISVTNLFKPSDKYSRYIQENDLTNNGFDGLTFLHYATRQVRLLKSRQTVQSQFGST
jgi:hypothetical protein